ncbi:Cerebral Dopamine Neurotrophic Factor [Manis pentadactyla]|nr:Cerebral Dopamine Neurotrophic Factor [Manis pentadactyla]
MSKLTVGSNVETEHGPVSCGILIIWAIKASPFKEKKLDLESLDLSKMRVAELKQILYSWEECRACVEKTDYVNLTKELAPKYAVTHPTTEL